MTSITFDLKELVAKVCQTTSTYKVRELRTTFSRKPDGSLITKADDLLQSALVKIVRSFVDAPVLAEEIHSFPDRETLDWWLTNGCWVIDPIDGTENYAYGGYVWSTAVAFVFQRIPILGLVYAPDVGLVAWADSMHSHYERTDSGGRLLGAGTRLSAPSVAPNFIYCTEQFVRSHRFSQALRPRAVGATSMNLLEVVMGRAIASVTAEYLWDFAATWALGRSLGFGLFGFATCREITSISSTIFIAPSQPRLKSPAIFTMADRLFSVRNAITADTD